MKTKQDNKKTRQIEINDASLELVSAAGDQRLDGEKPQEERQSDRPSMGTDDPKYGSELPIFEASRQEWNL